MANHVHSSLNGHGVWCRYDDLYLTEHLIILDGFTTHIGADWFVNTEDYEGTDGEIFHNAKIGPKIIKTPFMIKGNLRENYNAIQRILNKREPKQLVFGHENDVYYMAIAQDTLSFDQLNKNDGCGVIEWIIPDGCAHSINEKQFTGVQDGDVTKLNIVNNGSDWTNVSYSIQNNGADNGYISIISEHGAIELGDVAEVGNEQRRTTEYILRMPTASTIMSWDASIANVTTSTSNKSATLKEATYGTDLVELDQIPAGTGWHGASRSYIVPINEIDGVKPDNFEVGAHMVLHPSDVKQLGLVEMAVSDESGANICSVVLANYDTNRKTCVLIVRINGQEYLRKEYDADTTALSRETNTRVYIRKQGKKITVDADKVYTFDVPAIQGKRANMVTLLLCARDSFELPKLAIGNVVIMNLFTPYWHDIPNRYASDALIEIDGESGAVYLNGTRFDGDVIKGSTFFRVPPGTTDIEVRTSDFCTVKPTVIAKIREVFL